MRTCVPCRHPERVGMDEALLRGEPVREVAERLGLTRSAVHRHKAHVLPVLARAAEAREVAAADGLLGQAESLLADARRLLAGAEGDGDRRTAIAGVTAAARVLDLLARLAGELKVGTTINVAVLASPEWLGLRSRLVEALGPYPEARAALAGVLGAQP